MRALFSFVLICAVAAPAAAAPPRKPAGRAKPAAAARTAPAPARDLSLISEGKEAILVDHLVAERTTVVLFYRPAVKEEADLATDLGRRAETGPVTMRYVRLKDLSAPIARQYEITETPVAFVYDRNKQLLGKGHSAAGLAPLVTKGMRTARIKWVNEDDPTAAETYRIFGGGRAPVPEIMKTMSLRPEVMETMAQLARKYHFQDGYLTRREKEIVAAYVSALNKCKY